MVHCSSDEKAIAARLTAADDPYPPLDKVAESLRLFRKVQATSILPTIQYDFTKSTLTGAASMIISAASLSERDVAVISTRHWVGSPRPSLLMVGDRPGANQVHGPTVPFRPYNGASSAFLMKVLEKVTCPVAITNARDENDQEVSLGLLWEDLGKPRVAALGGEAKIALERTQVPYTELPHPQWVSRFHHGEHAKYGGLLTAIARGEDARWRT